MKGRHFLSLSLTLLAGSVSAFIQKAPVTPVGHEWLTVNAAAAIENDFTELRASSNEVTRHVGCWTCDQYGTNSLRVWSATMGQRWVDIMGFRAGP